MRGNFSGSVLQLYSTPYMHYHWLCCLFVVLNSVESGKHLRQECNMNGAINIVRTSCSMRTTIADSSSPFVTTAPHAGSRAVSTPSRVIWTWSSTRSTTSAARWNWKRGCTRLTRSTWPALLTRLAVTLTSNTANGRSSKLTFTASIRSDRSLFFYLAYLLASVEIIIIVMHYPSSSLRW